MKRNTHTIYFDMDGTICNLYKDPNWLERILNEDIGLFEEAEPMVNLNDFSKLINQLHKKGYKVGIITYMPWKTSKRYQLEVKKTKEQYLKNIFSQADFDEIHILDHNTPKNTVAQKGDRLIDDDINNRKAWNKGKAYTHEDIINKLKRIYKI